MCGSNLPVVYDIQGIRTAIGDVKDRLMTLHAVAGCDTVSALFREGKKKSSSLARNKDLMFCRSSRIPTVPAQDVRRWEK